MLEVVQFFLIKSGESEKHAMIFLPTDFDESPLCAYPPDRPVGPRYEFHAGRTGTIQITTFRRCPNAVEFPCWALSVNASEMSADQIRHTTATRYRDTPCGPTHLSWLIVHCSWLMGHGSWFMVQSSWFVVGRTYATQRKPRCSTCKIWQMNSYESDIDLHGLLHIEGSAKKCGKPGQWWTSR